MSRTAVILSRWFVLLAVGAAGLLLVVGNSFGPTDGYPRPDGTGLLAVMSGGCDVILIVCGALALFSKSPARGSASLAVWFVLPSLVTHYVWIGYGYST